MKKMMYWVLLLFAAVPSLAQVQNYNKELVLGFGVSFKTNFAPLGPVNQYWDTAAYSFFTGCHSNICDGAGNLLLATDGGLSIIRIG